MKKIRVLPRHSSTISGRVNGESYTVEFKNGEATVKDAVANQLVHKYGVAEFVVDDKKSGSKTKDENPEDENPEDENPEDENPENENPENDGDDPSTEDDKKVDGDTPEA